MIKKTIGFIVIISLTAIQSCNKNDDNKAYKVSEDEIRISSTLDSIFLLAHGAYLWNDQLPLVDRFYANKFLDLNLSETKCYENLLFSITQNAKDKDGELFELNPLNIHTPKYSAIVPKQFQINGSNNTYNISNTFGLSVVFKNNIPLLLYVDQNSPAGKSGLQRGQQILSINGEKILNEESFINQWKKSIAVSFIKLEVLDYNSKKREVRLNSASYEINPVLKRNIIHQDERKIGYLALSSFTQIQNAQKHLLPVFNSFKQENISELIIDLRYNQGGYQATADYLANIVSPNEANGKVMYSENYNSRMQNGNSKILEKYKLYDQFNHPVIVNGKEVSLYDIDYSIKSNTNYFNKDLSLQYLKKIYFIVSNRTASASELLINVLKPYIDTQVLGVSDNLQSPVYTYGKPVGSFGIQIGSFELYLAMYELKNAKGESNYFKGIKADKTFEDKITTDFGTFEDPVISSIFQNSKQKIAELKINHPINKYSYYFNNDRLTGIIKNTNDLKIKKN